MFLVIAVCESIWMKKIEVIFKDYSVINLIHYSFFLFLSLRPSLALSQNIDDSSICHKLRSTFYCA